MFSQTTLPTFLELRAPTTVVHRNCDIIRRTFKHALPGKCHDPCGINHHPGVCTFFARVTGSINGTYTNSIPARTMTGPVTNVREATANLTVQTRVIGITKTFSPASISTGSTSNLTIVLQNRTSSAYTGVGLIDTFPTRPDFCIRDRNGFRILYFTARCRFLLNPALTQLTLANATIPPGNVTIPWNLHNNCPSNRICCRILHKYSSGRIRLDRIQRCQ